MTAQCLAQATIRLGRHGYTVAPGYNVDGARVCVVHDCILDALKVITGFLMNSTVIKEVVEDRDRRPLVNQHIALMCLAFWEAAGWFDQEVDKPECYTHIRDKVDLVVELVFTALMSFAHFDFTEQLFSITNECEKVAIVIRTPKRPRVNRRPLITKKDKKPWVNP